MSMEQSGPAWGEPIPSGPNRFADAIREGLIVAERERSALAERFRSDREPEPDPIPENGLYRGFQRVRERHPGHMIGSGDSWVRVATLPPGCDEHLEEIDRGGDYWTMIDRLERRAANARR